MNYVYCILDEYGVFWFFVNLEFYNNISLDCIFYLLWYLINVLVFCEFFIIFVKGIICFFSRDGV